jgi:hypothetical protein
LSLAACLLGALAYEVTLPLFLLPAYLAWRRSHPAGVAFLVLFATIVIFKAVSTDRAGLPQSLLAHLTYVYTSAFWLQYVSLGAALPRVAWNAVQAAPDRIRLVVAGLTGVVAAAGLLRHARDGGWLAPRQWGRVIAAGVAVFVAGYAIFVTNSEVGFAKTGPGNRTAIAAALGAAISLVGGCGLISCFARTPRPSILFMVLVSTLCAIGTLITQTTASFWVGAFDRQQAVLKDFRSHVPRLPSGSMVILDGVCPYMGPAVVFENQWDLAGALRIMYLDRSLRADVMSAVVRIDPDAFVTQMYGVEARYPFGDLLFVYQLADKQLHPIVDRDAAGRYQDLFHSVGPPCPPGAPGQGVALF